MHAGGGAADGPPTGRGPVAAPWLAGLTAVRLSRTMMFFLT